MSIKANKNLTEIKRTYQLIDDNFDAIYAAGNAAQKATLIASRDAARDAFWKAVAENLTDDHELVTQTFDELKATNDQIKKDLQGLQDIAGFLNTLAQGVKLAAALASLAAA